MRKYVKFIFEEVDKHQTKSLGCDVRINSDCRNRLGNYYHNERQT